EHQGKHPRYHNKRQRQKNIKFRSHNPYLLIRFKCQTLFTFLSYIDYFKMSRTFDILAKKNPTGCPVGFYGYCFFSSEASLSAAPALAAASAALSGALPTLASSSSLSSVIRSSPTTLSGTISPL